MSCGRNVIDSIQLEWLKFTRNENKNCCDSSIVYLNANATTFTATGSIFTKNWKITFTDNDTIW